MQLDHVVHIPIQIRYIRVGQPVKGTVLLLHGIPTWGFLYRHQIRPLVNAGFEVIVPDLLGHGFSDRRDCFDRSFQTQATMVRQLLQALDRSAVDVVGHDTGGATALILAIESPSVVQRLVLPKRAESA